jgi:hypothetical protein
MKLKQKACHHWDEIDFLFYLKELAYFLHIEPIKDFLQICPVKKENVPLERKMSCRGGLL